MEVKGKAVFLTGGARGIGRSLGEALLKKGAKVFFCDINPVTGKATEAELQNQYGAENAIFEQCDVTNKDQYASVFKKAVDTFGAVDICVNNAGILDERLWEAEMDINATAQIRGSQMALEHMRRDKGGRGGIIINTVSMAGLLAVYNHPVYTASKHAMIGFTQSWATNPHLGDMGIRFGCLCPGFVDTDLMSMSEGDGKVIGLEKYSNACQKAKIKPEMVAEAFMTLVEDEGSNGAIMSVMPAPDGTSYRTKRRQLVDSDGVSNPTFVDKSFI